jgi:RimJ/RimL family protein N-acetyltransferase
VGEVEALRVIGGKCEDFVDTFDFMGNWVSDIDWVKTKADFKLFYENNILDVCVARDKENKIVCCSYVLAGYKSLNFTGYNREDYRSQKYSVPCAELALKYYFYKYDLVNRIDICFAENNRVVKLLSKKLGFKKIGVFPKMLPIRGIDTDYCYSTILRSEVS